MALEQRGRGAYYYRKVWRNGTCVSEYVAHGGFAFLAEWEAAAEREQRELDRQAWEEFKATQRRMDKTVDDYHKGVRRLVATVLRAAGYHQHKGQWRKAREMTQAVEKKEKGFTDQEMDEYMALLKAAADKGKESPEVKRLRDFANKHPALFDGYWMLTNSSMMNVIEGSGVSEAHAVHFRAETIALKRSLGSKNATPLEILLIDDIALCWLRLQFFEHAYSSAHSGTGVSLAKADYLEKRLSATRRRYHQAVETLARVRALLARAGVQINIANNQVVQNN